MICLSLCASCVQTPLQRANTTCDNQQALESVVLKRQYQDNSLSALAQVKMSKSGKSWSSTQALVIEAPNRLRVDMLNFFNQLTIQLAVADMQLSAYVPKDRTLYTGLPSVDNIQRFTGLPLAVTDLVALLLQKLPLGVIEMSSVSLWDDGLIFTPSPSDEYWLTIVDRRVIALEHRVSSYLVYRMLYAEFDSINGYPHQLELQVPLNDTVVKLRMDDVELNSVIGAEQFVLCPPATTLVKQLNEL
jgi:outer membrane lipoprotein-sorting protein